MHSTRMQQEAGFAITVSLGCCLAFPGESAIDILGKADKLMYAAKRDGKTAVCASAGAQPTVASSAVQSAIGIGLPNR
jgi:PleD family two-component response regulator